MQCISTCFYVIINLSFFRSAVFFSVSVYDHNLFQICLMLLQSSIKLSGAMQRKPFRCRYRYCQGPVTAFKTREGLGKKEEDPHETK